MHRCRKTQTGVALAIVVWFIAGMSLLVAGIVSQARVDSRMAQLHVARAKTVAAGDGAIMMSLAAALAGDGSAASVVTQRVGGVDVDVEIVPAAGLIDLNSASPQLLVALFRIGAGLDEGAAQNLADNVIKWRAPARGDRRGVQTAFAAPEDLLRVTGVNRAILDRVRDFVAAGVSRGGGGNWSAAPDSVLTILDRVDPRAAAAARTQRERSGQSGNGRFGSEGQPLASGVYRVDARVRYGDRLWLRRIWITTDSRNGSSLPWKALRIEAPRVVGALGAGT
tara:strand:- start:52153 stop:52995 length:843 start_codon:yes stop_codon:yes gene_type:complete